ncbi:hypothetical protein GGR54DRAFT_642011 [Hypoxylon sp. NC1633]|nr:hypothetical protein GGR54DRAFT_642011 [Hypoxylon sp. NC1633]
MPKPPRPPSPISYRQRSRIFEPEYDGNYTPMPLPPTTVGGFPMVREGSSVVRDVYHIQHPRRDMASHMPDSSNPGTSNNFPISLTISRDHTAGDSARKAASFAYLGSRIAHRPSLGRDIRRPRSPSPIHAQEREPAFFFNDDYIPPGGGVSPRYLYPRKWPPFRTETEDMRSPSFAAPLRRPATPSSVANSRSGVDASSNSQETQHHRISTFHHRDIYDSASPDRATEKSGPHYRTAPNLHHRFADPQGVRVLDINRIQKGLLRLAFYPYLCQTIQACRLRLTCHLHRHTYI